jgi:uncharacterized protein YndB with AHSA1/START domain
MEEPLIVTRDVDLDLDAAELWSLISDRDGWERWLVDDAAVDVEPGATGTVRDAGQDRELRITHVADGERVAFEWWPVDQPADASAVELVVVPSGHGAVLHVTETFPPRRTAMASAASFTWEVRALAAWAWAGRGVHA